MSDIIMGFPSLALVGFVIVITLHYLASMVKFFVGAALALSLCFYGFMATSAQKADMDSYAEAKLTSIKNIIPDIMDFVSTQTGISTTITADE